MELLAARWRRTPKMGRVGMGDVEARRGTRRTSERGLVLDFNILEESGACGSRQRHGSHLGRRSDTFPLGGHDFPTPDLCSEKRALFICTQVPFPVVQIYDFICICKSVPQENESDARPLARLY